MVNWGRKQEKNKRIKSRFGVKDKKKGKYKGQRREKGLPE